MDLRTTDHPEANGRAPRSGEQAWTLIFPLETGETLNVHFGKHGFEQVSQMVLDMMADTPSYSDAEQLKKYEAGLEVRPCPFCGSEANIEAALLAETPKKQLVSRRDRFSTGYWITCQGSECGLRMGYHEAYDECEGGEFESREEAAKAWNKRSLHA